MALERVGEVAEQQLFENRHTLRQRPGGRDALAEFLYRSCAPQRVERQMRVVEFAGWRRDERIGATRLEIDTDLVQWAVGLKEKRGRISAW